MSGSVETQLQCLKFGSSKMTESKTQDCSGLGCRHVDDGVGGQR